MVFGRVRGIEEIVQYPEKPARNTYRHSWEQATRIAALEEDADQNDRDHVALRREMKNIQKLLIGILMTTATAALAAIGNLVSGTFGGSGP